LIFKGQSLQEKPVQVNRYWSIRVGFGKRADLTSLKTRAKCIIEAHFEIAKYNLSIFEANDLDYEEDNH
jgi:hypothetical protein